MAYEKIVSKEELNESNESDGLSYCLHNALSDDDVVDSLMQSGSWKINDSDIYPKIELFKEKYKVICQQPDTDVSNFSATILKSKDDGQMVFATKGTDGLVDIIDADVFGIVTQGVPNENLLKKAA